MYGRFTIIPDEPRGMAGSDCYGAPSELYNIEKAVKNVIKDYFEEKKQQTITKDAYTARLFAEVRPKYPFFDGLYNLAKERDVPWDIAMDMYRAESGVVITREDENNFLRDVIP